MGKLRIPYVEIKEVEIDFDKVADIIYQCCKEDGFIDEYIENEETPEDAAEDMYASEDVKDIIANELPAEMDLYDIVWEDVYLEDNIYSALIGPLTERVKNDLIKKQEQLDKGEENIEDNA